MAGKAANIAKNHRPVKRVIKQEIMALKKFKPKTAGTRWRIGNAYAEVTTSTPEKSLLEKVKSTGGRNFQGRQSMRYIGGGHKKMFRVIDFKRNKCCFASEPVLMQCDRLGFLNDFSTGDRTAS